MKSTLLIGAFILEIVFYFILFLSRSFSCSDIHVCALLVPLHSYTIRMLDYTSASAQKLSEFQTQNLYSRARFIFIAHFIWCCCCCRRAALLSPFSSHFSVLLSCTVKHRYKCFIIFMCLAKVHKRFFTVLAIFSHSGKQSTKKEDNNNINNSNFQFPVKCNCSLLPFIHQDFIASVIAT